jgi:hypothetical protein
MPLIISHEGLADEDVKSNANAVHRIARSLGGRMRLLWELTTGQSPDGSPASGLNPDGGVGANRSGYPWGPAFQHPVWVGAGVRAQADVQGDRNFVDIGATNDVLFRIKVICRPFFQRRSTPYSRAYFRCVASRSTSGTPSTTVSLTSAAGITRSATVAPSGVTPATFSPDLYVDIVPGINKIDLRFSKSSGNAIQIVSCSLNQIVERTH